RSMTTDGGVPLSVLEAVAWVRYLRSKLLPAEQQRGDRAAAAEYFAAIALVDRSLVPADLLRDLDGRADHDQPAPTEAVQLANDSIALRMRYQRTGNPRT
ncbi:hypothetical protein G3I24_11070, partial [Micromonospora aurantiaca]|nr:hypothetical protein [Micromonospora aurantiaca]